jgi:F-type H+-transporting ATPase subunit epsilon
MKLTLTSLGNLVAVHDEIVSLRAEDASGSFGIRPGHADFLTVLDIGVVSWRLPDGQELHSAVRRGVLRVHGGDAVDIATREAIVDSDLERLESTVLARFRAREESERSTRTESQRFEVKALREIMRYLRPARRSGKGRTP